MFHFRARVYNNVSFNTFQVTKVLTHSLLKNFLKRLNAKCGNLLAKPSKWRTGRGKKLTPFI